MKMIHKLFVMLLGMMFLSGCISVQEPIGMKNGAISKSDRIGVVMTAIPKADTSFPGAGCLLCLAAASAANSKLTDHTKTLSSDDLKKIKLDIADVLKKKEVSGVVVIDEELVLDAIPENKKAGPNFSEKDYSVTAKKYNVDKLIVLNVAAIGFERTYSSYFPTADPKGIVYGAAYLVNASDNAYEWYLPIKVNKSSDAEWDEPPQFPGLTNAYYQAIELAKDEVLKPINAL